jgi:hypothetical protein
MIIKYGTSFIVYISLMYIYESYFYKAGYRNPMQDLIETAIYWSENELGKINRDKFFAFIGGYKKSRGVTRRLENDINKWLFGEVRLAGI